MRTATRIAVALALVGVVLFVLGLMGVAEPPRYTPQDLHEEAKPSPLMGIGILLSVFGGLLATVVRAISRE